MKNEQGSTLITVLLISLVFITIGLTIASMTITSTKQAEIRRIDVSTAAQSTDEMDRVIADFTDSVTKLSLADMSKGDYETKLQAITSGLETKYTTTGSTQTVLTITDITQAKLGISNPQDYYTRYYNFQLQYVNNENSAQPTLTNTSKRTMLLSPTPSFLQYAVGSEHTLNLNGASDITGNVYGNTVTLANAARYANQLITTNQTTPYFTLHETLYPSIKGSVVVDNEMDVYNNTTKQDGLPSTVINKQSLQATPANTAANYFYEKSTPPMLQKSMGTFTTVDFPKTVADKLNMLGIGLQIKKTDIPLTTGTDAENQQKRSAIVQKILATNSPSLCVVDNSKNPNDLFSSQALQGKKVVLLTNTAQTNGTNTYTIANNLTLAQNQWLVVDGNLDLSSSQSPLTIQGNILVLGNITIHGDPVSFSHTQDTMAFATTIYATGKATITSTNIVGSNNKMLVLLTQDDLLITRINELTNATNQVPTMDGYFYTDHNAEMYGVGSLFHIHGGIFAKNELTINAIRQNSFGSITSTDTVVNLPFDSRSDQIGQASRFVVNYDKSVLVNNVDALPFATTLNVISDDAGTQTKGNGS
ncbi:hypothetical protein [Ectobacillus polymachus]|uniref:hypothetical protein n=1 Tax=Ectobacillus polymachus TaxID=1508806 RepID=UPI003A87CD2D